MITQHFGEAAGKPITVDGFIKSMNGPAGKMLGVPVYTNRIVLSMSVEGSGHNTHSHVVEQHTSTLRPMGGDPVSLEVVLVVQMSDRGVLTMAEYLDPSPIALAVKKTMRGAAKIKKTTTKEGSSRL
jgi:hypothetical protein